MSSSTDTGGEEKNQCINKKRKEKKKKSSRVWRREGNHSGEREQRIKVCRSKVRDAEAQNDGALTQGISKLVQKYIRSWRMTKGKCIARSPTYKGEGARNISQAIIKGGCSVSSYNFSCH